MLATTLRSIGDGVVTTDLDAKITFINPVAELLTGWTNEEALGRKSYEVFCIKDESTGKRVKCPVMRVLETGAPTDYTNHTLIISCDGSERPVAYEATPLRDGDRSSLGVVLVFHQAQSAEEMRRTEERLNLVARATNDAVWDWDLKTSKMWWNDAVTTLFGYSAEDIGATVDWFFERLHPIDRERIEADLNHARDDGMRYWQHEYCFRHRNGTYNYVLERGYVLRDSKGEAVRMVGAMMDFTTRREAQEELLRANQELELQVEERTAELRRVNRELESFTYSVSHDLRSPLRSILFQSAVLQEDSGDHLDDEAKATLARLVLSAKRMSKLIDDLLQYSRLSRSKLHLERIDLSEIASAAARELKENAGCPAEFAVEPNMVVEADRGLMTILYENLLSNACKFSARRPAPRVEVGSHEVRGERVYFVRDNGVGFDPQDAKRLFTPFERLHSDREFPGTGIGLANVHRVVHRHGGRIWAEGYPNQGATFFFTLG